MKKAFFITLLFCFLVESANSEIVELKCKPDGNDEYSIELSVDLENRTININSPFPPLENLKIFKISIFKCLIFPQIFQFPLR